ncbi:uncharacterized protein DNG_09192 [Cephalotrichum gorgonifer]|uniref:Zn(2)-C6 fungal-type domain-containing protein n=1 Tax=Cephalotrichum gorgonifer TaxID=2041049 RepID=A0AAE8N5D5_9PEZI|nr:uncharacterized protein DNG_09192 [Cephalotrichum gorgonifer]
MASTSSSTSSGQQSCWECARRRLVCDSSRPACDKCRSSGIVCPGYADAKPLRWLAPGRVTSRVRRKGKGGGKKATSPKSTDGKSASTSPSASTSASAATTGSTSGTKSTVVPSQNSDSSSDCAGLSDESWSSDDWQVSSWTPVAAEELRTGVVSPRAAVDLFVPRVGLVSETAEIVQATYYFNNHVYPEYASDQLTPTQFIVPLPLEVVCLAPFEIAHILVSVALRHRIYRVASSLRSRENVRELRSKYHHHRGLAISALNEQIRKSEPKYAYALMVGVMTFAFAELQRSSTPAWKFHMDAFVHLTARNGGMRNICAITHHMKITMTLFSLIYVTGSTTSPASTFTLSPDELEDILEYNAHVWEESPYPNFLCPTEVFLLLIQINHLRSKLVDTPLSDIGLSPEDLLAKLKAFSPEEWAAKKPNLQDHWLLIARAHQSAAIIYMLSVLGQHFESSALQNLEILRAIHATRLFALLMEAEATPPVKRACLWPVVVGGVEAVREGPAARAFVGRVFEGLADDLATPLMLEAKRVFEVFWSSGKEGWDDCFDKPYAFVL